MRNPFKRRKAKDPSSVLPDEVATAIETCQVVIRHDRIEAYDRILVVMPGRRWWIENSLSNLKERYPELNDAQLARAVNWLDSRVASEIRTAKDRLRETGEAAPRWADWRPMRDIYKI